MVDTDLDHGTRYQELYPAAEDRPWSRPGQDRDIDADRCIGRITSPAPVPGIDEIETLRKWSAGREAHGFTRLGFLVVASPVTFSQRARLAELALAHRLPGMFGSKENVAAGGLISYGADLNDLARRSAAYIDKILKGAKPADLPVEQASKYQLVINLKTARALGLEVPPSLLARADEVIE